MKFLIVLAITLSANVWGDVPTGIFKLDKIQCSDGKVLNIGGRFFDYSMKLVTGSEKMTVTAVNASKTIANFKLTCTIVNEGDYQNVEDGKFRGELKEKNCVCKNKRGEINKLFTNKICAKKYGEEPLGISNYTFIEGKLLIDNPETTNIYSCENGSHPVYYYHKI